MRAAILAAQPTTLPGQLNSQINIKYDNEKQSIEKNESQEIKDYSKDTDDIKTDFQAHLRDNIKEQKRFENQVVKAQSAVDQQLLVLLPYSNITFFNFVKVNILQGENYKPGLRWRSLIPIALIAGTFCQLTSGGLALAVVYVENLPTPTATFTVTPTASYTPTPTATFTPSQTFTPSITPTPSNTMTPTITKTPTVTLPASTIFSCIPNSTTREVAYVYQVIDGDTIEVRINGELYDLRYLGIDTPEQGDYYSYNATLRNSQLVAGSWVTLIRDTENMDAYGRLLRYVVIGNTFVNYQLVQEGYATAENYGSNVSCSSFLSETMADARAQNRGMWKPTSTPAPTVVEGNIGGGSNSGDDDAQGSCHPSYPTVCIPPPPPDLDCGQIGYRNFTVTGSDPHRFDGDNDGVGCES